MKIEFSTFHTVSSDSVITNLVSFTLIVSAVVFLGAVCRYLKECCAGLSKKRNKDNDVIAFTEVRRISQIRKSYSLPRINTQEYSIVHQEEVPINTEEMPIQPAISAVKQDIFLRPRAPTDPGRSPKVSRQISAPAPYTPRALAWGETSPLAKRILSRDWTSHADLKSTDLEPQLYKKEASLQKFQSSNKNTCGDLDTEVYYNANSSELKVTVNSIHQVVHKHSDEMNTYVSVKKIPDQKSRRTSLHTRAVDPVYNDEFAFQIDPRDDITSHVLIYGLYHVDKFSTSYLRGEACLPLFQLDLDSRRKLRIPFVEIKRSLLDNMYPTYRPGLSGCILLSLKYEPSKNNIVVTPVRVRYVPRKRQVGYGKSVYIKVDLRHRGERTKKMKTGLMEMDRMPGRDVDFYEATFNEPLALEYKSLLAEESVIIVSLNHYLFLKSSFIIGQVRISRSETGYQSMHFQSMLDSPGEEISVWYEMRGYTIPSALEEVKQ